MLTKGYVATSEDLDKHVSGQLVIGREDGVLGKRTGVHRDILRKTILVRPGLKGGLKFYAVTILPEGKLVSISDGKQTRYYWLTQRRRSTLLVDYSSSSFESAWSNLFKGLLADSKVATVRFYNDVYVLFLRHFQEEGVKQTFGIEGVYNREDFAASVEWDPEQPGKLDVSSTYDTRESRSVPFAFHPIEAIHRVARK